MNNDFEDRIRSMLAHRAGAASAEPDLQRVMADATQGSPRRPVERLVFLAAVAIILAVVALGNVLGSPFSGEQAILEPGDTPGPTVGETPNSAIATTTRVQTTSPVTTPPAATDCFVITTDGADGMVEELNCPTTTPGPGASLTCGSVQVAVTQPGTTFVTQPGTTFVTQPGTTGCASTVTINYTCDPATWPEGVTSNTDPSCTPTEPTPTAPATTDTTASATTDTSSINQQPNQGK